LPVTFVAGDIFNYFRLLDDQHVAFYHLDVSGHGVPSAMLSVTLSKLISNETKPNNSLHLSEAAPLALPFKDRRQSRGSEKALLTSPDVVVTNLNKAFQSSNDGDLYFTMIYGSLDMATGELQFCQAGHPSPIFLPLSGEVRMVGEGGFPVGMLPDVSFDTYRIQLQAGDRLFLYSDGITECSHGENHTLFGEEQLVEWFTENRDLSLSELKNALERKLLEWHGSSDFEDDVSFLALEYKPHHSY
jgi:sigma-B regulation protein RsbU (phosphoserine phosphatase)